MPDNEVTTKTWELRRLHQEMKYTCFYSPNEKHSLCPNQETCILNEEVANAYDEIKKNKQEIKSLKKIYDDSITHYQKTNQPSYVGFTPKSNTLQRMVLEQKNKKHYRRLKEIKTKQGGYN